jgi:hypothetical protein
MTLQEQTIMEPGDLQERQAFDIELDRAKQKEKWLFEVIPNCRLKTRIDREKAPCDESRMSSHGYRSHRRGSPPRDPALARANSIRHFSAKAALESWICWYLCIPSFQLNWARLRKTNFEKRLLKPDGPAASSLDMTLGPQAPPAIARMVLKHRKRRDEKTSSCDAMGAMRRFIVAKRRRRVH